MQHTAMAPSDDLQWGERAAGVQQGREDRRARSAIRRKAGALFVVRLKMPSGYKIMPHWHPTDENVTVISGSFAVGMGDKLDPKTKALPAGSFASMPATMHHYAFTKSEAVVEVSGMGPFQLNVRRSRRRSVEASIAAK